MTELPPLDDARVDAMERQVFLRIAREQDARRTRRTRGWAIGGGAAAVVLVAALIAPAVSTGLRPAPAAEQATDVVGDQPISVLPGSALPEGVAGSGAVMDAATGVARETISSGSAAVVVDDVRASADEIAADAEARGGYVESLNIGAGDSAAQGYPMPVDRAPVTGSGWITVRVPADQLAATIGGLDAVGEVTSSSVAAQDVTDQTIDLRARIAAAEASVARLTELMAQAQSTADLIAAESALQERQATLDADRQQLAAVEGQVALASLSVQLTARGVAVAADPAGFGDGLAAGWNGLVATLNGIVIALGFLLPWLAVIAAAGLIARAVVSWRRHARRRPSPASPPTPPTP